MVIWKSMQNSGYKVLMCQIQETNISFEQVFLTLGWSSFVFALCLPIEKIAYLPYGDLCLSYPKVT